jgi:hypothetical protein
MTGALGGGFGVVTVRFGTTRETTILVATAFGARFGTAPTGDSVVAAAIAVVGCGSDDELLEAVGGLDEDGARTVRGATDLEVGLALVEVNAALAEVTLELRSLLVLVAGLFGTGGIRPGTVTATLDDGDPEVCGTETDVTGKATSLPAVSDVFGNTDGRA